MTDGPPGSRLPSSTVRALSIGHGGMSVLINLPNILLVYFYLPPQDAGLPPLITDRTLFLVVNAIVLVAAFGRVLDAVTDPLIALWSDRSRHRLGRRIPFMRWGAVPAAIGVFALFFPPVLARSGWNILWLVGVQAVLFVALTAYVTPAFALVADLGRTQTERLDLTTWTTVAWSTGIVVAALTPVAADGFAAIDGVTTLRAWQMAVGVVVTLAAIAMLVPTLVIDERSQARSEPASVPFSDIRRIVLGNRYFRYYLAADLAYFTGLIIVQTGLLYYLTVLLRLSESVTAPLLGVMVIGAMILYPLVNTYAKRFRSRPLVVGAFVLSALVFVLIGFLGRYPIPPFAQALVMVILLAPAFSVLSVIPGWILSDIAEQSARATGLATAGMFFAARTFLQKAAQTIGVVLFAALTTLGRDVGDDLGIRLSAGAGFVLYAVAAVVFSRFDEDGLIAELNGPPGGSKNTQSNTEVSSPRSIPQSVYVTDTQKLEK